jgi:arsenate reductase-like glutaredoxin family protein
MVKFIKKHHKNDKTIFWPDLASCHYAKKTLEWLEQKNIEIVLKAVNPLRPEPLKMFGLCWLVQFMPKDIRQKMGLNLS